MREELSLSAACMRDCTGRNIFFQQLNLDVDNYFLYNVFPMPRSRVYTRAYLPVADAVYQSVHLSVYKFIISNRSAL